MCFLESGGGVFFLGRRDRTPAGVPGKGRSNGLLTVTVRSLAGPVPPPPIARFQRLASGRWGEARGLVNRVVGGFQTAALDPPRGGGGYPRGYGKPWRGSQPKGRDRWRRGRGARGGGAWGTGATVDDLR